MQSLQCTIKQPRILARIRVHILARILVNILTRILANILVRILLILLKILGRILVNILPRIFDNIDVSREDPRERFSFPYTTFSSKFSIRPN
jgi:hypothetical protein